MAKSSLKNVPDTRIDLSTFFTPEALLSTKLLCPVIAFGLTQFVQQRLSVCGGNYAPQYFPGMVATHQ